MGSYTNSQLITRMGRIYWVYRNVAVSNTTDPLNDDMYVSGAKKGYPDLLPKAYCTANVASTDVGTSGGLPYRFYNTITVIHYDANNFETKNISYGSYRTTAGNLVQDFEIPSAWLPESGRVYVAYRLIRVAGPNYILENNFIVVEHSTSFLMDRAPTKPSITGVTNGQEFLIDDGYNIHIIWDHVDEDTEAPVPADVFPYKWDTSNDSLRYRDYGGWEFQMRQAPTPSVPNPAWGYIELSERPFGFRGDSWHLYNHVYGEGHHGIRIFLYGDDLSEPGLEGMLSDYIAPGTFQIRVRTFDMAAPEATDSDTSAILVVAEARGTASPWSDTITFSVIGPYAPPDLNYPNDDEAVEVGSITFDWTFLDPRVGGGTQYQRWLRIREAGASVWTELLTGDVSDVWTYTWTNGNLFTIVAGKRYEWEVRTVSTPGGWDTNWLGQTASFWAVAPADSGPVIPVASLTFPDPGLGCGVNRAFVYMRGGQQVLGEITNMDSLSWERIRDDISVCDISIRGWGSDCGELLSRLRSWMMEIVVFRDNGSGPVRVWEGPITRITYEKDQVSIEAKDPMAYVYRRIIRIGYSDAYRTQYRWSSGPNPILLDKRIIGSPRTVTYRAKSIIQNALSYDDPNVLPYLRVIQQATDAKQSRTVEPFSRTAWQEIDDLAAKGGLDYVTVGRRIILWDVHNVIGLLPEMRDGDFDNSPVVTEYGMQLANVYGVTNNNGVYGVADRLNADGTPGPYGFVEMLVSAWGESDGSAVDETLTDEARAALTEALTGQAERGIASRWPTPVVVRIPDGSTLNPELSISINQLIPGVHIPLRSNATLRELVQMQKLDRVRVSQDSNGETIQVTMSPAPGTGEDPDAAAAAEGV